MIAPTRTPDLNAPTPRPHPAVVFKPVAEGAVLLQTETEVYFGLNAVGTAIWKLLGESAGVADLCTRLEEMYPEAPRDAVEADVTDLINRLSDEQLVVSR